MMIYSHNLDLPRPEEVIPHRPPHLWLDGVTTLTNGIGAEGFWTPSTEHFDGHFPAMPLLPGVKCVEAIAQLGAYAFMIDSDQPVWPIFKRIEDAKFVSPTRPGQTLELSIEILDRKRHEFTAKGHAKVGGALACSAMIDGALLPEALANRLLWSRAGPAK